MKNHWMIVLIVGCGILAGCADMDIPTPTTILKEPIGPNAARHGMSKDRVISLYGEPAFKSMVSSPDWDAPREEWFYTARISGLPVNSEYLAKDLYLYFDGGSLTNVSYKPLGKEEKKTGS
ncbi:MAG: outer membrane protein assembly factor BamE [Candidatus Omnitrophica bacterium]|nr:outer membrane protein assembly factor BamE [Candidatus Omnitrophota bacterium]MBU1128740.1 outer membrane protein assembly factor BamE [Candidatus Omnitrophota bacterium]MBU1784004.1 outer membrane protein assembly factor BamE [Candidatus Omnitrophota bacterium]MBU1851781.1 outer membrane protein assembly factor BamE [Candidatus Omnitrophota bacterium]